MVGSTKAINSLFLNISDDADKLNARAFFLEPGAALISGGGRKEGTVGGDDLVGDEAQ
jgi:hypothetical protein